MPLNLEAELEKIEALTDIKKVKDKCAARDRVITQHEKTMRDWGRLPLSKLRRKSYRALLCARNLLTDGISLQGDPEDIPDLDKLDIPDIQS